MKLSKTIRRFVPVVLACATFACSESKNVSYDLLPAKPIENENAEAERLRKMQLITVLDGDGNKHELSNYDFDVLLNEKCGDTEACLPEGQEDTCVTEACWASRELCRAETVRALVKPQGSKVKIGEYTFPLQTEAANHALATLGVEFAKRAGTSLFLTLETALDPESQHCNEDDSFNGTSVARYGTAALAQAFEDFKQLTDAAVSAGLNASDADLNSTPSTALASKRAVRDWRSRAARQLGGIGDFTLPGENGAFCTRPAAGPDVRAAIAIFRDAAQAPNDILSTTISTSDLLDASGSVVPSGSVRQRLAQFHNSAVLASGGIGAVEAQYNLDLSTFDEARAVLSEEIVAFARSREAVLQRRTLPDNTTATYDSYAGTATAPTRLPSAYYGALARNGFGNGSGPSSSPGYSDYGRSFEGFLSIAADVQQRTKPPSFDSIALAPISLMLARSELVAHVEAYEASAEGHAFDINVFGYAPDDGIKLAFGEDDLRCAVQGTIEGATCSLAALQPLWELPSTTYIPAPFSKAAFYAYPTVFSGPTAFNVYLLKPKFAPDPNSPRAILSPGQYEAVVGLPPYGERTAMVIKGNEDRIAAILEPSREWCARPQVTCDGSQFDERIALEDELTDDNSGIENSWKHYLELAKSAAEQADALGNDYINESLANAENLEQNERAKQQQLEQADSQLEKLQQLCGFTADTHSLLKLLSDENGNLITTTTTCDLSPSACAAGYQCQGYQDADRLGTCTLVDIVAYLKAHDTDPDIRRIADCVAGSNRVPYTSLGDRPLCLWRDATNPNLVCKNSAGNDAKAGTCPQILSFGSTVSGSPVTSVDWDSNWPARVARVKAACAAQLASVRPSGAETVVSKPLGYFNVSQDATNSGGTDFYDKIRSMDPASWPTMRDQVTAGNYLDPNALVDTIQSLDWESRFDGYAAIKFLGTEIYTTGEGTTGPALHVLSNPTRPAPWPCGTGDQTLGTDRPWRGNANRPASFDCTSTDGLAAARTEMFATVAAAKMLGPLLDKQLYDQDVDDPFIHFGSIEHGQVGSVTTKEKCFLWNCDKYSLPNYNCGSFKTTGESRICDSAKTLLRPDGSAVLRSSCDTGTAYTTAAAGSNEYGDQFANLGCFREKLLTASDHGTFDTALQGLAASFPVPDGKVAGWVSRYLDGKAALGDKVGSLSWDKNNGARVPGAQDKTLNLTGADLMSGLALIARGLSKNAPAVTLDHPPVVRTVDDLQAVSLYVDRAAMVIRNGVSSLAFANLPLKVADALRSESAAGSYPQLSGDMAKQISAARGALLRIHQNGPLIANEVAQIAGDIKALKVLLRKSKIRQDISGLQMASEINNQLTACALSFTHVSMDPVAGAGAAYASAITCANSIAQIGFASDIATLTQQDAELDGQLAIADFGSKFSAHSTSMQTLASQLRQGSEDLDAALASIETDRSLAKSALISALDAGSFQAQHQAEVTNVIGNLASAKQLRYTAALTNAKRLSFVAKRAIEQRLAIRLSDITEAYPLVEAPATWESTNCDMTGLDYTKLTTKDANAPVSFANGFIGDYVRKLENFVESYPLKQNFHEGADTAVISLKNDIMNVRKQCEVDSSNLLQNAGQLELRPAWVTQNCPTQSVDGTQQPLPDCVDVTRMADGPLFVDASAAKTTGYSIAFGASSGTTTAVAQTVTLPAGLYRFSWYTLDPEVDANGVPSANGGSGGFVSVEHQSSGLIPATVAGGWTRVYLQFDIDAPQDVTVGFMHTTTTPVTVRVSAPMLERLQQINVAQALVPFVNTNAKGREVRSECEDQDGRVFRSSRWRKSCTKLCADGFADNCSAGNSKDYCYWEADFGFSQRDIQLGKVFNFSGFARGNFNYRIDSIGINFVGTGTRDCSQSESPQTCYAAGFLPYSLTHMGPFFVRNYKGADVPTLLFDGSIEHARGLASERYVTNPISQSDSGLIEQYMRHEFAGRPLDGNFVLRVWDEDGVDFNSIEDVQVVLRYRYWTKFD